MGMFSSNVMLIGAGASVTLELVVAADIDDGADANGLWDGDDFFDVAGNNGPVSDCGFRFTGCNIPAGATIVSAIFTIEITSVFTSPDIIVHVQNVNNAGTWNGVGPATMAVTTANITRSPSGTGPEVFDVKTMVQEVVDGKSGIGGAIAIGVLDDASASFNAIFVDMRDSGSGDEATLVIEFTT